MSRSFGATELTSRPSMRISPEEIVSRPAIIASNVDLPQPEGPTSAMNSPVRASRSTPLRTSTEPKLLRNLEMVSDDIPAPSFDRALRQSSHEIFAAEEIDQQRRNRADQDARAHHVIDPDAGAPRRHADERGGDRLTAAGRENDAEQIFVPDAGELPDHRHDRDRRGKRQNDLEENAPESGAVDPRRLDQIVGDVEVIIAAEQRREGNALHAMNEDQPRDRVAEPDMAKNERPGHQRNLTRHEDAEHHAGEDDFRARKAPFGENVTVQQAEHRGDDRGGNGHFQRIEEIMLDARAGSADAIGTPHRAPSLE